MPLLIPDLVQTKIDYYRWKEYYHDVMIEYENRVTTTVVFNGYIQVEYDFIFVCFLSPEAATRYSYYSDDIISNFSKPPVGRIQPYAKRFDNIPYMVKNGIITKKYQDYIQEIS